MRTPRTNAAKEPVTEMKDHPDEKDFIVGYIVKSEFAERLETELIEALEKIENLKRDISGLEAACISLEADNYDLCN